MTATTTAESTAVPARYRPFLHLPDDVQPGGDVEVDSGAVLLTGATGFLGSALLGELLTREPDRVVYCIVRPGAATPSERLRSSLADFGLWDDTWGDRVRAVAGDLGEPGAGLDSRDATVLRDDVSLIYHSGAFVNLAFPFEHIVDVNVGGTVEMMRLAGQGRPKRVAHISTLSTIDIESRTGEELADPAPLGAFEAMTTGYTRSKWVSERLVEQASQRGLDVRCLRLGALAGHSRTGVSNPNDYAWLVVRACLEIGAVPLLRAPTSWLPVDHVARASIALSTMPTQEYLPYQVLPAGQVTYAQIFSWLRRAGYHLATLSFSRWRDRLRERAEHSSSAVQAIASVIPRDGLPGEAQPDLHSPRTERVLSQQGASTPTLTEDTFRVFLDAGQRRGEIPA
ncbi:thioester reductase domain-containing protein [Solicola gregarius]|uniref:Thioester reductase domain-containing protein n=1 Tax=Solicola gregarius TaxID=2908642 RepID=A0AA46TE24_9ACTN|nr:thioester reductase domain-containing protein [Solicola gregarius]UYM03639.1 thioester reductase domain-containing protein [Solicola gregarius]